MWCLSFDCASKSFAFSLIKIDDGLLGSISADVNLALSCLSQCQNCLADIKRDLPILALADALIFEKDARMRQIDDLVNSATAALKRARANSGALVSWFGGGAVDLFPGIHDKKIRTVDRIRGIRQYISDVVCGTIRRAEKWGCPAIGASPHDKLNVLVEYQMGPNAPSRIVSDVIITMFADENVLIVGAGLKNKVFFLDDEHSRHCYFLEKYASSYLANKAHSKYCLDYMVKLFGLIGVDESAPKKLKKDLADSFMQVIGWYRYGDRTTQHF